MSKLPAHLKKQVKFGADYFKIKKILKEKKLNTICETSGCPNISECFSRAHLTFMILGSICTRNCAFCGVEKGAPLAPDPDEPDKIAETAALLALKYVIVTSVCRDDMKDGGAGLFAATVEKIKKTAPAIKIEILIPDFRGDHNLVKSVCDSDPDVIGHNIETVPSLYKQYRRMSDYRRSIDIFRVIKSASPNIATKSSIMLGLGETENETIKTMTDLKNAGCDRIVLGQYIKPNDGSAECREYIPPEIFLKYEKIARRIGFSSVLSNSFARSSYEADTIQ